jgi:hypothetical protein
VSGKAALRRVCSHNSGEISTEFQIETTSRGRQLIPQGFWPAFWRGGS